MTPEEKRNKMLGKLREAPQPVITKVVTVGKTGLDAEDENAVGHLNIFVPKKLIKRVHRYKVESGMTIIQICEQALTEFLDNYARS